MMMITNSVRKIIGNWIYTTTNNKEKGKVENVIMKFKIVKTDIL